MQKPLSDFDPEQKRRIYINVVLWALAAISVGYGLGAEHTDGDGYLGLSMLLIAGALAWSTHTTQRGNRDRIAQLIELLNQDVFLREKPQTRAKRLRHELSEPYMQQQQHTREEDSS